MFLTLQAFIFVFFVFQKIYYAYACPFLLIIYLSHSLIHTDSNACTDSVKVPIIQPDAIVSFQNPTICYGEKFKTGDSTYTSSGTYLNKFKATNGCDSTVTTILTVKPPVNITVSVTGTVLTAIDTNSTYQWIDCSNGNTVIPGATNRSYTVLVNGNYAVVLTQQNCIDTSKCIPVIVSGITNTSINNQLSIFPNPSNGSFTIQTTIPGNYSIINELGQVIENFLLNNTNNNTKIINDLSNGSYYIIGLNENQLIKQKVIVLQP